MGLISLIGINLNAQDTVHVQLDTQIIKGDFIEPYTNKWQVSVIDSLGNKEIVRIWTDYAQILEIEGEEYLHRVQDLYSPLYELEQTWVNIVKHKNLLPKRFTLQNASGGLQNIDFSMNDIVIKSNIEGQEYSPEKIEISQPLYDWNLYGMLLVGLPFEEGQIFSIPFWSQPEKSADYLVAEINGKVTVKTLKGEEILTHKVTTNKGLTFWLTKEKPYVIQLELQLPTGSTMLWEMM